MAILPSVVFKGYQKKDIQYMLAHNYILNSNEQGLGKTLEAIAVQQATDDYCLIICPYTLKYGWKEEYEKFTDERSVNVGLKQAKINIVNFEQVYRCSELFSRARIVIIDEAHYLINEEAERTAYVHRMVEKYRPERLILLTGTPIKERVPDFHSLLKLLSYTPVKNNGRSITDKYSSKVKFSNHFSNKETFSVKVKTKKGGEFYKKITKYSGVKNERELKAYMKFKYIRRVASKELDLPPIIFKDVIVSYKNNPELEAEYKKYLKTGDFDVPTKVNAAIATAPFTADYVKDLLKSGAKPVIVFSDHIEPLRIIGKKLGKTKHDFIIGDIDAKKRQEIITRFQNKELDVILGTYGAMGTGTTLTASSNMVLNDDTWEVTLYDQAIKRFHRIGQFRSCVVHKIIGSKVSRRINKILIDKQKDIGKLIEK